MLQALRVRDFRLLWAGGVISNLGTWLLTIAIPAHILQVTGSLRDTGLAVAAEYLPLVLLGPLAGVISDRHDRRRLMIGANLLCAASVAAMLTGLAPGRYAALYLALIGENTGIVLYGPALQARVPAIVGTGPLLSAANSLTSFSGGAVRLIGGPLGGILLVLLGPRWLISADALSYVLCAGALYRTARTDGPADAGAAGRSAADAGAADAGAAGGGAADAGAADAGAAGGGAADAGAADAGAAGGGAADGSAADAGAAGGGATGSRWRPAAAAHRAGRDLAEGLRALRGQPTARALLPVLALFLFANTALSAILIAFGVQRLGGSEHTGFLLSGLGIGYLVGAPVTRLLLDRTAPRLLLAFALGATAAAFLALFTSSSLAVAVPAAAAVGAFGSMSLVVSSTTMQRVIDNAVLGRVSAVFLTVESAASLLGAVGGPFLAQAAGLSGVAIAASLVTLGAAALTVVLVPPAPALAPVPPAVRPGS
jgi:MFS family permease